MVEVRKTLEYVAASKRSAHPITIAGFDNQNTAVHRFAWIDGVLRASDIDPTVAAVLRRQYRAFGVRSTVSDLDSLLSSLRALRSAVTSTGTMAGPGLHRRAIDDAILQVEMFRTAASRTNRAFVAEDNNPRDRRMAENLLWLVRERYPRRRIVAWIATPHALHHPAEIRDSTGKGIYGGMETTGSLLRQALG